MTSEPTPELDERYSSEDATATPWSAAADLLDRAQIAWFSTVRVGGGVHGTPLVFVRAAGRLFVHTGTDEQKTRNLDADPSCSLLVGTGSSDRGLDVSVDGRAVLVTDEATLQIVADGFDAKYPGVWHYEVGDGALRSDDGRSPLVYEIVPVRAYGFGKGEVSSHTRWTFTGGELAE